MHIYEIVQIVVFGSYLDRKLPQLGDLDLAIVTRVRTETGPTSSDLAKRALAYADASGRQFSTFSTS
jgi:predicted nucleotidyltransferase